MIFKVSGDKIVLELTHSALEYAIVLCPALEEYNEEAHGFSHPKVTDSKLFIKELIRALNHEEENGDTLIHKMLDEAFVYMIEQGAEGVEMVLDARL